MNNDTEQVLNRALLSLTLVRSMAVPERAEECEVIFEHYSGDELFAGLAQMATLLIRMEAQKNNVTPNTYIESFREYLLETLQSDTP